MTAVRGPAAGTPAQDTLCLRWAISCVSRRRGSPLCRMCASPLRGALCKGRGHPPAPPQTAQCNTYFVKGSNIFIRSNWRVNIWFKHTLKVYFFPLILTWELWSGTSFLQISKSKIYMTSSSLEFLDKKIIQDGLKCMNLNVLETHL